MNLTNAPIIFRRTLDTMIIIPLILISMVATLFACQQSARTPQSAHATAPTSTPATAEVLEPEFPLSVTTASVVTQGVVSFESVVDRDKREYRVILNPGAQVIVEPTSYILRVEDQRDFNGDGIIDALISFSSGGNCCPPTYAFLTIYNGKAFVSALAEDWAEYSVNEERGYVIVAQKHLEATDYWRLEGTTAIKVGSKPKLEAVAEIYGVGAHYMGTEEALALRVDIDDDGITDSITCGIWPRWGSLSNCVLPLPRGDSQPLDVACDRLGALKTVRNGRHELVCNNNIVIYFDGTSWRWNE